jgi:cephalosporin hydroxylase
MNTIDKPGHDAFQARNAEMTRRMAADPQVRATTRDWVTAVLPYEYHYHFSWLGVPIIQFPSDIAAMQELMWEVKPDLVIETGIARGGSLVFYASMQELNGGDGRVVGIDRDIRDHAREAIGGHPLGRRITMVQGSSVDEATVREVARHAEGRQRVLVVLDSNHTAEHVTAELRLYSPFVTRGSYIVVFDTVIDDLPDRFHEGKEWKAGHGPKAAVRQFLAANPAFQVDSRFEEKLLVTVSPEGFLKRL